MSPQPPPTRTTPDDLHRTVHRRLRGVRGRYSSGRRALVEALVASGRPITVREVVEEHPSLSTSSVYRNLSVLEQAGVVRRLHAQPGDDAHFELAEELTHHHHHLVCDRCGAVIDYELPPAAERALGRAFDAIPAHVGFRPRAHHVQVLGLCDACAAT